MTSPTTNCFSLIRGRAMRITRVDTCGLPLPGPRNQAASAGFISIALTANNDEGTTISVTNANGDICIRDVPPPKFLNYTVEVQFCDVNPDVVSLVTGNPLVLDADDNRVGFDVGSDVDLNDVRFALEAWSVVPADECEGGLKSYGYFLLPFLQGGQFGDFTIGNDAVNFTLSGAQTKDGSSWGAGPYKVQLDDTGASGPLVTPIGIKKHLRVISTQVAPPATEDCGAGPVGSKATTAVAGVPGHYTPANSYGGDTVSGLSGVTASPTTAWTSGQYVLLADGVTQAHWTGTAWAAGAA